jgi:hypothetical protein
MLHRISMLVVACVAIFALAIGATIAAEPETHTGKVVSAGDGKLVMTDADGTNEHTHAITDTCKITLDGQPAKLEDLKEGNAVTVTTEEQDGKDVVTAVAATS